MIIIDSNVSKAAHKICIMFQMELNIVNFVCHIIKKFKMVFSAYQNVD